MFLVACVGCIHDAANTRKNEALGASRMRRSVTSNLTPKFLRHTRRVGAVDTILFFCYTFLNT